MATGSISKKLRDSYVKILGRRGISHDPLSDQSPTVQIIISTTRHSLSHRAFDPRSTNQVTRRDSNTRPNLSQTCLDRRPTLPTVEEYAIDRSGPSTDHPTTQALVFLLRTCRAQDSGGVRAYHTGKPDRRNPVSGLVRHYVHSKGSTGTKQENSPPREGTWPTTSQGSE
jgi:hypothetical protein